MFGVYPRQGQPFSAYVMVASDVTSKAKHGQWPNLVKIKQVQRNGVNIRRVAWWVTFHCERNADLEFYLRGQGHGHRLNFQRTSAASE